MNKVTVEQFLQTIVTGLAVISSILATYLNWKKAGEKTQDDAVWKALTDKKLLDLSERLKDIKDDNKEIKALMQKQSNDISQISTSVYDHERQLVAAWKNIDAL